MFGKYHLSYNMMPQNAGGTAFQCCSSLQRACGPVRDIILIVVVQFEIMNCVVLTLNDQQGLSIRVLRILRCLGWSLRLIRLKI